MRVLIVSEDAQVRLAVASDLSAVADVELVEAVTAAAAHALLDEGGFDVLVIDGDLQPEGGFSVLYELRAQGDLRGVPTPPAIVLTARADDRFLADWARADDIVRKPVEPFELTRRVLRLAGTRSSDVEAYDSGDLPDPRAAAEAAPDV